MVAYAEHVAASVPSATTPGRGRNMAAIRRRDTKPATAVAIAFEWT